MAVYHSDVPGIIVGHLLKVILKLCYCYVRHDERISRKATGGRKYSEEDVGMEMQCELNVTGSARRKLKQL